MKLQWKLVIGLLIGMLVIGQIVAIRYAVARDQDMQSAQAQLRDAVAATQTAQQNWQKMNQELSKMQSMPLTDNEKQAIKVMQMNASVQQNFLTAQIHCLNAIQRVYTHVDKMQ